MGIVAPLRTAIGLDAGTGPWRGRTAHWFVELTNLGDKLARSVWTIQTVRELSPLRGRALQAGLRLLTRRTSRLDLPAALALRALAKVLKAFQSIARALPTN